MRLDAPVFLWLLVIVPLFAWASLLSIRRVVAWHAAFARAQKSGARLALQTLLLCVVLLVVCAAVARPRIQHPRTVFNRSGIDILVGVDVSKSMLAEDTLLPAEAAQIFGLPNRLNRARFFALEILGRLKGERIGVFLFARKGVEVVPFTRDYGFCRYVLSYINDAEITLPGSDLGEAIRTAVGMFEMDGSRAARILVLLSDGEDIRPDPSFFSESAMLAAEKGVKIFTVGVGAGRSVLIPVRSEDRTRVVNYYVDEEGNHLKTRMELEPLKTIARLTGGKYAAAAEQDAPESLMKAILKEARGMEYTRATELAWMELSPFLLLSGFVVFVCGFWLGR